MWTPVLPPDPEVGMWVNLKSAVLALWQRGETLFNETEPEALTRRRAAAMQWLEENRNEEV